MELTLEINGKQKIFQQDKVSFLTMKKAIKYSKMLEKSYQNVADGEVGDAEEESAMAVDLILAYFNGQFTYDEFVNSTTFATIGEVYELAMQIMMDVLVGQEVENISTSKEQTPSM